MKNYKVKTLTDKYNSTVKIYPKVIEECLPEDYQGLPDAVEEIPTVVANPDPAGETELTGLQVGETKYKINTGKQLYQHTIRLYSSTDRYSIMVVIVNDNNTQFTVESLATYLKNKGFNDTNKLYPCMGVQRPSGSSLNVYNLIYANTNDYYPTVMGGKLDGSEAIASMTYASITDIVITL